MDILQKIHSFRFICEGCILTVCNYASLFQIFNPVHFFSDLGFKVTKKSKTSVGVICAVTRRGCPLCQTSKEPSPYDFSAIAIHFMGDEENQLEKLSSAFQISAICFTYSVIVFFYT
ncbi:hypothetical protein XELAEV_18035764mg [Xenopus laevis]|uniref:Uncharacterized protein n=1 Tax=Xenopus laevis TaxID=8355 RepID=A0A974HCE5_XENLA|nr:hypothetical protein XELAEV_18035764mg [Xenopus laevis]